MFEEFKADGRPPKRRKWYRRDNVTRDKWCVSCATGSGIEGAILHVWIPRSDVGWKPQYGDANLLRFKNTDEAFAFALERGYLQPYFTSPDLRQRRIERHQKGEMFHGKYVAKAV